MLLPKLLGIIVVAALTFHGALSFNLLGPHQANRFVVKASGVVAPQEDANNNNISDGVASDLGKRARLPRSERKARERARKAQRSSRMSNRRKRHHTLVQQQPIGQEELVGTIQLRSNYVPELTHLTQQSTSEDVLRAIKTAQNMHDINDLKAISRFLLNYTDSSYADGCKGSLLSRLAVAALHLGSHRIATSAIASRRVNFRTSILPVESAALVRNLLRTLNITEAWQVLEDELSLPAVEEDGPRPQSETLNRNLLKHRAQALASVASWHFLEGDTREGVLACRKLAAMGVIIREAGISGSELELPWSRLLQGASKCQAMLRNGTTDVNLENDTRGPSINDMANTRIPCNVVYSVLDVMMSLPSVNDDRVYELLSNALVRRVLFVTGAVNMDGCPSPDRGEAAFIGRSNVGKSSLVNMITNRKSLAYISKRPGKTQQFNFFAVND